MTPRNANLAQHEYLPRAWRIGLVAVCTLILCSCRAPEKFSAHSPALPQKTLTASAANMGATAGLSSSADNTAKHVDPNVQQVGYEQAIEQEAQGTKELASFTPAVPRESDYTYPIPLPYAPTGPWSPPGIRLPWPVDEYLIDGGDRDYPAAVGPDWQVHGLEPEDTIAHYDTVDGRTLVEPSNRVVLYAPRFGAVRKVVSLVQDDQVVQPGGVGQPIQLVRQDDLQIVGSSKQQIEAVRQNSTLPLVIYRAKVGEGAVSAAQGLGSFQDAFQPYENLKIIRDGVVDKWESAFLAQGIAAAIIWTDTESVQVVLDHQSAAAEVSDRKPFQVYTVKSPPGHPKLRIVKVASTQMAEPGDVIDFTLRFDNVGNQPIGNVTILDNLTTRLEYVAESAQCSLDGKFQTESNQVGSDVLRWEITNPLPPSEGGIIRFRCRVR